MSADYDTLIDAPAVPTRTGYMFAFWCKDASGWYVWDFSTDTVQSDTTLFAQWTPNQYTVSFDSQGGSEIGPTAEYYGNPIPTFEEPTRDGYTFAGWTKDAAGADAWDFLTDTVKSDTTLYAQWIEDTSEPLTVAVFRAGWSDTYELGQKIDLAARGEGGTAPYKYLFYVIRSNGLRANFRSAPVSSNIYPWTPVTPDTYSLGVEITDAMGDTVSQEVPITVWEGTDPLTVAVFRAGWSDTYELGQKIDLAARGEGGTAPYKYLFYAIRPNGSRANFRSGPVNSNIYPWTPVTPASYRIGVEIYDAAGRMVRQETPINVISSSTEPLSIAVFRAGWSETYKTGQVINLAARGEGGTPGYKYQFYVIRSNGSRVNFRSTPVSSNIYPWTPLTPDNYIMGVDVYDLNGTKVTSELPITVVADTDSTP